MSASLSPGTLAFIALCNEYCSTIQQASDSTREEFVGSMIKILPRLYISSVDLRLPETISDDEDDFYITATLDEEYYDSLRRSIENLLGGDDTYLEVFEEDMRFSDTPIASSVSENLADIFQSAYNFIEMIRDAPEDIVNSALRAMREDFKTYWSQLLCNVMRPLNNLYNSQSDEEI